MLLTSNQKTNIILIVCDTVILDRKNINVNDTIARFKINGVRESNVELSINIDRWLYPSEIRKLNDFIGYEVNINKVTYLLSISKITNDMKIELKGVDFAQVSLLDNNVSDDSKFLAVHEYDNQITDRLNKHRELLINVFNDDDNIESWTFFFVSPGNYIGLANKVGNVCFRVPYHEFNLYRNEEIPSFYDNVRCIDGTLTDAECKCLKRNMNSKCYSNWKVCKKGTSIDDLLKLWASAGLNKYN